MAIGLPGDKNKRPNQHNTAHHPNWDRFISSTLYSNKIERRRFCHVIPSSYMAIPIYSLQGSLHVISKLIYRTLLIVFHNIIITKNNNNSSSYDHGKGNHRMECFVGSCPVAVLDLLLVSSSFSFNTFHKCLLVCPEEKPTTTTFPL